MGLGRRLWKFTSPAMIAVCILVRRCVLIVDSAKSKAYLALCEIVLGACMVKRMDRTFKKFDFKTLL